MSKYLQLRLRIDLIHEFSVSLGESNQKNYPSEWKELVMKGWLYLL